MLSELQLFVVVSHLSSACAPKQSVLEANKVVAMVLVLAC